MQLVVGRRSELGDENKLALAAHTKKLDSFGLTTYHIRFNSESYEIARNQSIGGQQLI